MSKLKDVRTRQGLTQKEVSESSGVNLRILQYYEQGANDINKAQALTVYKIAQALECRVEDILELQSVKDRLKKLVFFFINSKLTIDIVHFRMYNNKCSKEVTNQEELKLKEIELANESMMQLADIFMLDAESDVIEASSFFVEGLVAELIEYVYANNIHIDQSQFFLAHLW